jgi:hypothetical protein
MGEDTIVHRVLLGRLREIEHSGDHDIDESIIIKWSRSKLDGSWGLEKIWLRIGPVAGTLVWGKELSGSVCAGVYIY